jgi:hypothetical protein
LAHVTRRGIVVSAYLALANRVTTVPAAIVSMRHDVEIAGVMAWSLQFAMQLPMVLAIAARQVQVSVASNQRLLGHDDEWLEGVTPLVLSGLALALLQAVSAPLLIPLVFPDRWNAAIESVQVLSIGQVLLPLVVVQAGNALISGRVAHVVVGTLLALLVIIGASWWSTTGAPDTDTAGLVVGAGFLACHAINWLVVEALEGKLAGRTAVMVLAVTVVGFALLAGFRFREHGPDNGTLLNVLLWTVLLVSSVAAARAWVAMLGRSPPHSE